MEPVPPIHRQDLSVHAQHVPRLDRDSCGEEEEGRESIRGLMTIEQLSFQALNGWGGMLLVIAHIYIYRKASRSCRCSDRAVP